MQPELTPNTLNYFVVTRLTITRPIPIPHLVFNCALPPVPFSTSITTLRTRKPLTYNVFPRRPKFLPFTRPMLP